MSQTEALIAYPCDYLFKVMGRQQECTPELVASLLASILNEDVSPALVKTQPSERGNYVSLSLTVRLLSETQRVAVYAAMAAEKRILFAL
jgi:uncharacterized protein